MKVLCPICCHTCACTGPADSPGRFGVSAVAGVGTGTVKVVLPARAVARACAIKVVPRMKFTIGSPKPEVREARARDREGGRRVRQVDRASG